MTKLKKLFFVIFFIVAVVSLYAVTYRDVVYLKNGSIIKGTIIEQIPDESLKIETADGSVFVYSMKDVKKIKKEKVKEEESDETTSVSQYAANARTLESNPEKNFALLVNPLGFLQFGPQIDLEIKTLPSLYLVGSLRWHGGGLLSYALTANLQSSAIAFGGGLRYFIRTQDTPDALFIGAFAQYGIVPTAGTNDDGEDWQANSNYIAAGGEIGYRWRFNPAIITVGALAGLAQTIYDQWWYVSDPADKFNNNLQTFIFGMLEVSFGFEF